MRRRRRDESLEKFRRRRALPDAEPLAAALREWAADAAVTEHLAAADPALPDELGDRQQDACEALVAIADLAGGEWPQRSRKALVAITAEARKAAAAESLGTLLLADMRDALDGRADHLATAALLDYLRGLDERPWAGWNDGAGIKARDVAKLLKPFEIRPTTVRLGDGTTPRGYRRADCDDAFARYLPPVTARCATPQEECGIAAGSDPQHDPPMLPIDGAGFSLNQANVADVADIAGGKGQRGRFCEACTTPPTCEREGCQEVARLAGEHRRRSADEDRGAER
jgi:Protein of unknown function (DUF3631)